MQGASKVGALVIVFFVLFYGAYVVLGRSLGEKNKTYFAEFPDAGGVPTGTPVLMAGVQIGTVEKVALVSPRLARLTLSVRRDVQIPEGSEAVLPTSIISLGNMTVQIVPPANPTGILAENAVIKGTLPNPLEAMLPGSKEAVKELTATLAATRKLLENRDLTGNMEALMKTSNDAIAKFGNLASQTQLLMAENRKQINSAIHSASLAMADVQTSTSMIAKLLKDGKIQKESVALLQSLNETTTKAQGLMADIDKFVNDPKLREPMNTTMANVADMTTTGKAIAKNSEEITANGAVVSKKAIELAEKASLIEDDARKLMEKLGNFFNKPGVKAPPIHLSMDLTRQSKPVYWRTDITAEFPLYDNDAYVGVYDAFGANKLVAEMGRPFIRNGKYRYGIYASKPALGVDYAFTPALGLRGDAYDINDPHLDMRLQYEVRDGIFGWLGIDHVFKTNAPTIGFGVHK